MIVEREKNDESKLKVLGNCWWKILLFKQQQLSTTLPALPAKSLFSAEAGWFKDTEVEIGSWNLLELRKSWH